MPCTAKTDNNTKVNILEAELFFKSHFISADAEKNNLYNVFDAALNTHQSAKKYWRLFAITEVLRKNFTGGGRLLEHE